MPVEEHAASPLAGGISQHGHQCGLAWGAALAAGAHAYRLHGAGPVAESSAIDAAQRIVAAFRDRTGYVDCRDVTGADWKQASASSTLRFFAKGGPIRCFSLVAVFSQQALGVIHETQEFETPSDVQDVSDVRDVSHVPDMPDMPDMPDVRDVPDAPDVPDVPDLPVSCAALMARRLGASDEQATMAAGFAGGIGLSGGACGALAAAVWMFGVNGGAEDLAYGSADPRVEAIIEKYLESAGHVFECAAVVGRHFESVADHAEHLRRGGCSEIVGALAEP